MESEIEDMARIDICGRLQRILTAADGHRVQRAWDSWLRQTTRQFSRLRIYERLFTEIEKDRLRRALRAWNRNTHDAAHRAHRAELATFEKTIATLKVEIAQLHFEYKI